MRKISYGILIFIISLLFIPNAFALDTSIKVYDDAGLLSYDERVKLQEEAKEFVEKYNMDIVLVTTSNSYPSGTTAYADDFYDYNGFGIGNTNDGLLLLIDRTYGYNDLWISTTGEAILVYDDNRIDNILDNIVLQKDNGYYAMFSTFISEASYYAEKGKAPSNNGYYINENGDMVHKRTFPWFMITIVSLIVPSVIVGILVSKNKMIKKETTASVYLDQSSVKYTRKEDRFITTHTSSVYVPRNTGGGSSHSGGGSSVHRSSSGTSHGGGGRRC